MHALIIEDETFIALLIEDHLRRLGYRSFDFAVTEAEALIAANGQRPDLITSDMQLPQGSGLGAVEAICKGNPVPVVFITANPWEVREKMSDAIVVKKPLVEEELVRAVARAGRLGQLEQYGA